MTEAHATFACFASTCSVFVIGDGDAWSAEDAVAWARAQLELWHRDFTRFEPDSELSRLNADGGHAVAVSPAMARFAELVRNAASLTNGLVDGTLLGEIETAGYATDLTVPIDLAEALTQAPKRRPARPKAGSRWRQLRVDRANNVVFRPPGLRLDSGGLAKGLFCDLLAETLGSHEAFGVDCAGDLRIGGRAGVAREIRVASPFDADTLRTFRATDTAVATSGIGRRSWLDAQGRPCHHLLDPSTGRPAFTGVVQVTAFAPTAALAEICAKAALLNGPDRARSWLPSGGVIVFDDRSHAIVDPAPETLLA